MCWKPEIGKPALESGSFSRPILETGWLGWLALETGLGGVEAPQARPHDCGLRALRGLRSASLRGMEELVGTVFSKAHPVIRARCKPDVIVAELERRGAFDGVDPDLRRRRDVAAARGGACGEELISCAWPFSRLVLENGWLGACFPCGYWKMAG